MTFERSSETDFPSLIAERGVRAAAEHLVHAYATDVYGLCRAIVRDRVLAEDLAHDVFTRALTSLSTYRGEASARTWLLTIARNRCFDHLRAQKRERALIFDEPEQIEQKPADEPLVLDRMATEESLRTALDALDEGDRALVVLRHAHAMGFTELAQVFGVREGTIRMRLSRAVVRMKAALDAPPFAAASAPAMQRMPAPFAGPPMSAAPAPEAPPARGMAPSPFARAVAHLPRAARAWLGGEPPAPSLPQIAVLGPETVSDALTTRLAALVASLA